MPIELRRSDVVLASADVLQKGAQAAGEIYDSMYEAERVSQVNRQLAYIEQSYQRYNEGVDQQEYTHYEDAQPHPSNPSGSAAVKLPFGQASLADIEAAENEFFQDQLKYITENTTNKAAREEMIQHLQMKQIQNQAIIARQWNVAADHEAMASLNTLYDTVLASNDPWEAKVHRITSRVNEMVAVGRLWKDEGEVIIARATAAAQYSFAQNGAMTMMKETGDPAAGEAWLAENTPFYDANPDARAQVLADVRREFDYFAKTEDEALDVAFADLHIRADTIEKVDAALIGLADTRFYNGDTKYKWEQRFMARRAYILSLDDLPEPAKQTLENWQMRREDVVRAQIVLGKINGVPLGELLKIATDSYEFADFNGAWSPRIRGAFLKEMEQYLEATDDPVFVNGLKYIQDKVAGNRGLSPEEKLRITNQYIAWFDAHPDATDAEAEQAALNFVDPVERRNLDNTAQAFMRRIMGDDRTLDQWERMTGEIAGNLYLGLTGDRAADLEQYGAGLVARAQEQFPHHDIVSSFVDSTNEYGGGAGGAILVSGAAVPYAYKLEEGTKYLTLYRLAHRRDGTYAWQEVGEAGTATGETDAAAAAVQAAGAAQYVEEPITSGETGLNERLVALRDNPDVDQDVLEGYIAKLEQRGTIEIELIDEITDFLTAAEPRAPGRRLDVRSVN